MNRILLFTIPFFFECITSFFLAAVPYLAMDLGGNQAQMGIVSTIFIAVQIPFFFIVGKLVNKFGKYPIIYTGAFIISLFVFITSKSQDIANIFFHGDLNVSKNILTLIVLASLGNLGHAIFYPSLQALMGDMSSGEKLTKDVGIYNMGWCFGAAFVALTSPYLVELGGSVKALLIAGGICGALTIILVTVNLIISRNLAKAEKIEINTDDDIPENNETWLLLGRLGMFLGFFSYGAYRNILPIFLREAGWADSKILMVTGMFMVGEAIGVVGCAAITFWKLKVSPQVIANIFYGICALIVLFVRIPSVLAVSFFICGVAMAVCYTNALFHAVSSHSSVRAKNTGYHELIVAGGIVGACLLGSIGGKISDICNIEILRNLPFYFIIGFVVVNFVIFNKIKLRIKK